MSERGENLKSLWEKLKTEQDAVRYFQEKEIIPKTKLCRRRHEMHIAISGGSNTWRCCKRSCSKTVSVRKGTWLEGGTLPLSTVAVFIYSWVNNLTTVRFCMKELGISHGTVVDYNTYMREVCAEDLLRNPVQIGGPGTVVEIDETVYSKKKHSLGKVRKKYSRVKAPKEQCVFGGVCRETRQVFLYAVPCGNRETIEECIKASVLPETTIHSDLWRAYSHIPEMPEYRFEHRTVSYWSSLTHYNIRRCTTHPFMTDPSLCEFMWRRRHENCDQYQKMLQCIATFP